MIGFRAFAIFSVLVHGAFFAAFAPDFCSPPELSVVPAQGGVRVSFSESAPPAPPALPALPALPEVAPAAEAVPPAPEPEPASEAPLVLPEPEPEPKPEPEPERKAEPEPVPAAKPAVEPEKVSVAPRVPEKKKKPARKAKREERKAPAREEKKASEAQAAPVPSSPEPEKDPVIGQGSAPSYARFLPPEYPPKARRQNIQGRVLLRVLVDREGRAADIQVVESSHPEFTRAARKSARRSSYVPMKRLGQPVESWVLIPFHFQLR